VSKAASKVSTSKETDIGMQKGMNELMVEFGSNNFEVITLCEELPISIK